VMIAYLIRRVTGGHPKIPLPPGTPPELPRQLQIMM
jgi:hypothetical protein